MSKKGKLLLVEDEEDLRELLVMILTPVVERVYTAGNGLEALDVLEKEDVDVILSDVSMPQMTGIELLNEVNKRNLDIPFLFLSAYANTLEAKQVEKKVFDFLGKPFSKDELKMAVEKAIAFKTKTS